MKCLDFPDLIGKKVAALRGYEREKFGNKFVDTDYMLFDDGETFMQFTEQDPYDYHDCSGFARHINIRADKKEWKRIHDELEESTESFVL